MDNQIKSKEIYHLFRFLLSNSFTLESKIFVDFYLRKDYSSINSVIKNQYGLSSGITSFSFKQLQLFINSLLISIFKKNIKLTCIIFFLKLLKYQNPSELHSLAFNKFSSLLIAARFSIKDITTYEYQHGLSFRHSYKVNLHTKVLPNVRKVPIKSDLKFLKTLYSYDKRNCKPMLEPLFKDFIYGDINLKPQSSSGKILVYAHSPTGVNYIDEFIESEILCSPKISKIKPHFNSSLNNLKHKIIDSDWLNLNKKNVIIISFFSSFLIKANRDGFDCMQLVIDELPNQKIEFINQINFNSL